MISDTDYTQEQLFNAYDCALKRIESSDSHENKRRHMDDFGRWYFDYRKWYLEETLVGDGIEGVPNDLNEILRKPDYA